MVYIYMPKIPTLVYIYKDRDFYKLLIKIKLKQKYFLLFVPVAYEKYLLHDAQISIHSTSPPQISRNLRKSCPETTMLAVFSHGWKLILPASRKSLSM